MAEAQETAYENNTPSVTESPEPRSQAVVVWQIGIVLVVVLFLGFLAWRLIANQSV